MATGRFLRTASGTVARALLAWAAHAGGAEAAKVRQIKVLTDKAPDFSTRKSIIETVTRGCETNDAKAVAIYNFARYAWYHHAYPGEKGGIAALKYLNVYGWGLCGGQHSVLCSLWEAAGFDTRFIGWSGHTTVECRYDEQWHYFDTFLKCYFWKAAPDAPGGRTVASQADIANDPAIVSEGLVFDKARKVYYPKGNRFEIINDKANWQAPALFVCGDEPKGVVSGVKGRRTPSEPNKKRGHMGIGFDENGYNTDVDLAAGMSLELMWKALPDCWYWMGSKRPPFHSCTDKDFRNCPAIGPILEPYVGVYEPRGRRTYANGVLIYQPDLSSDAFLAGLAASENVKVAGGQVVPAEASRPASMTVELQSPYVLVKATGQADGVDKAEVSGDGAKFDEVELKDFSKAVNGKYRCLLRLSVGKALKMLRIEVVVQHNRCSLPYLSPGPNRITVSVAEAKSLGENRLAVTYAYCLGWRDRSYEEIAERDAELARAHYAHWSDTPTVVRNTFAAGELPATFSIDVPTPKDKHPVYPRMLFLRREVLSPGARPMPLPAGAVEPKVGKDDVLKTLPNPFIMGIAKPPKKVERPIATKKVPLFCSHVVKTDGQVFDNFHIKWRPKEYEAWVMLVGGELGKLPAPRDIAAARICLPVVNSCPQATTQVGCTLLEAPFQKNKPYDFKKLGEVLGTVNVPKQAAPGAAKYYRIDVTRAVKQIAAGEAKFHGFCIRTIPNRSVDDGWTTRIDITKKEVTYLELDAYAK